MNSLFLVLSAFAVLLFLTSAQEPCPYCEDLSCGSDGMGGNCGTCSSGQSCLRGRCVCNRDCTARQCGPDPCGTDCGECLPGQTCVNGICTGACTPQCTRTVNGQPKTCGWDRCGGNCGSCPTNFRCKDGVCLCYPECQGKNCGPDGCGGTCGTCVSTEPNREAVCVDEAIVATHGVGDIGNCMYLCKTCGDGVCSDTETSTQIQSDRTGKAYCPEDCGSVTGVISLAVGQKDQLTGIRIDFYKVNPFVQGDRELNGFATNHVFSDEKGSFGVYNITLEGGDTVVQEHRIYFRLRGTTIDRTSGSDVPVPLLDLWWNFPLINQAEVNQSPHFYFFMSPTFPDSTALFRVILSWGTLLDDRGATIPDLDLFVAGPVDSTTMAADNVNYRNGIVNFDNKNYKSETQSTVLPFAKTVADQAQGFGPEVIDVLKDIRIGAPEQAIGLSGEYPAGANEVNELEFWVDKPNSNSNANNEVKKIANTNSFIIVYRGSSVNPTVVNEQLFFGDYDTEHPFLFGFANLDPYNMIPADAIGWHVFNLAYSALNSDTDLSGVNTVNYFEFETIPDDIKYVHELGQVFAPTKTFPCSHTVANGVPPELAYCPYTITYPQTKK